MPGKIRSKVGFVSLGCPKNLVDTERMILWLSERGATITGDQSDADVVVINTCGFLESAKNESLDTITEFAELRSAGELSGLVVAGCMTERYLDLMRNKFPQVDAFIQTKEFSKIVEIVEAIETNDKTFLDTRLSLIGESNEHLKGHSEITDYVTRSAGKRAFAYVKISEGCDRKCSFCIIPKLRGRLHSRAIEGVINEVEQLVRFGTPEVVLIAQDLTSYGRDLKSDVSLTSLVRELEKVAGLQWYRLMYNYPRFFTDELIEVLASSTKFTKYLDIPFQHSSDTMLKRMNRPESAADIRKLIEKLRNAIPGLSLRTTLMVGFPGETDADFENLLEFVQFAQFDHMGAFTYFREEGTPSADLPDQVPEEVKIERHRRLMEAQKAIQKKRLKGLKGAIVEVNIEGVADRTKQGVVFRGRHRGQAPEIDGLTYVMSKEVLHPGDIVSVEIQKVVGDYDVLGAEVAHSTVLERSGGPFKTGEQRERLSAEVHKVRVSR